MDLSRLVNNDAAAVQQTPRPAVNVQQQHARFPVAQGNDGYTTTDQRSYPPQVQLNRQHSSGPGPSRPAEHTGGQHYPPSLNTGVGSYQSHPSASPSPYPVYQQSPYTRQPSGSRRSSNERMPATPLQLQPPQSAHPYTHSPSASSHHSQTPQSAHHSPMPVLQYGGGQHGPSPVHYQASNPGQGLAPPHHVRGHSDFGSSPQQYRQPLGPPPLPASIESPVSRRSSEQHSRSRAQSASISPKTLPPQPSLSRETSVNGISHYAANGPPPPHFSTPSQHSNSASPAPLDTSIKRPTIRRSHTMDMKHLLTPSAEVAPQLGAQVTPSATGSAIAVPETKKRALEDSNANERPVKRTRRYAERPPWAIYSARNSRSGAAPVRARAPVQRVAQSQAPTKPQNGVVHAVSDLNIDMEKPWLNTQLFDMDLIHARQVMGVWEKSIRWNTPYPDLLRGVQDWLMFNLDQHRDVIDSPERATIEIEAKIGTLSKHDGRPAALPILNMAVLSPQTNRDHRFESSLELDDFKRVNDFLNDCATMSKQPGRQPFSYSRVKETDSFLDLAPAGIDMLPHSLKRIANSGRSLSLRTTTQDNGEVTARIVKVSIADLHIYNPSGYDCRISMNAEVDFNRDDIDPGAITFRPTTENKAQPERRKDRISYKHLAYQMDLTNVQTPGMPSKYEIEIEADAQVLSQQIRLMHQSQPHAFTEVVSGFLDNATYLMRQQKSGGR